MFYKLLLKRKKCFFFQKCDSLKKVRLKSVSFERRAKMIAKQSLKD